MRRWLRTLFTVCECGWIRETTYDPWERVFQPDCPRHTQRLPR